VVEKAFTTNGRDARRLQELAKEKNRILTVYHNRRWDGDFLTVRQLVESGRLGNMVEAELHFSRFRPVLSAKLHKEMPGPGSGLLLDLGPHLADQAIQLFGIPESVSARLAITRPGSQVDDFFDLALFYPDFTVRLKAGFFVRHLPASFILHGTRCSYLQPRSNIQEEQLMAGKSPLDAGFGTGAESGKGELFFEDESGSPIKEPITLLPGNYMEFYHRLHAGIRLGSTLPVTSDEAVAVMDLLDAAVASHGSGQVERVRG
jgi:predicted dehydrogenase